MRKHKNLFLLLLLFLILSFALYGNTIRGDFIQDDLPYIQNRQDLRDLTQFFNFFITSYNFQQPGIGLFRPLTQVSFMFNFAFGDSPVSFHIVNIILHTLVVFMVFIVIKLLTSSKKLALFTALLFLFHPIHTEALSPIVGRSEILAFLFSLIAIYLFLKNHHFWGIFAFLLAIFSKETALITAPLIYYLQWVKEKKLPKLKNYLLFLIPLGVYFLLRFIALGKFIFHPNSTTIVENPLHFVSFSERIFTALKVLYLYIEKLIFPVQLSIDYSYNVIKIVNSPFTSFESLLGIFIFVGLGVLMFYPKTRRTPLGLGAAVFLFPYLLISNLVLTIGTIMGERLIYFSSMGFCLILAFILYKLSSISKKWNILAYTLLILILIFYGARTITRNEDLISNDTLYKVSLKQHPDAFLTRLYWSSRYEQLGKWDDAKKQLTAASRIYPKNSTLYIGTGFYEEFMGNYQKAEEDYKKAIAIDNKSIEGYFQLGVFYLNRQNYSLSEENLLKAIELYQDPQFFTYYLQTTINLNKPQLAIDAIHKYYGKNPKDPEIVYDLGAAYYANRDLANAFTYLKRAKSLGVTTNTIDIMLKDIENKVLR